MIDHGPLNAPGVASLTEGAISTRSARKALKDGAAMGAFEELPGALAVYRPTRATLEELVQTQEAQQPTPDTATLTPPSE